MIELLEFDCRPLPHTGAPYKQRPEPQKVLMASASHAKDPWNLERNGRTIQRNVLKVNVKRPPCGWEGSEIQTTPQTLACVDKVEICRLHTSPTTSLAGHRVRVEMP